MGWLRCVLRDVQLPLSLRSEWTRFASLRVICASVGGLVMALVVAGLAGVSLYLLIHSHAVRIDLHASRSGKAQADVVSTW